MIARFRPLVREKSVLFAFHEPVPSGYFGASMATVRRPPLMLAAVRLAALALVSLALAARVSAEALPGPHPRIVNGILTTDYPSVGALLRGGSPDSASTWCSGTMIGCSTFLTAAHCVENRPANSFFVFLPQAGMFSVASVKMHPTFDFPAGDVAIVKLGTPVTGVAPSLIETTAAPANGSTGTIVGFGRSGDPNVDYGLKRVGNVVTASCAGIPAPANATTSVCWDYTAPVGPPGTDSNTCNADSGGPLFVDQGSGPRVAGITSGGSASSCQPTDHSYDASVYNYRTFITDEAGADLANTTCGTGPQAGQAGTTTTAFSGTVNGTVPNATHSFNVGNGTTRLLVAMNGVDDGASDFDLYVKAGSAPTEDVYDCTRRGPNQFGVCEFTAPASDPWHVLLHRYSGAGTYQLTVTQFATACVAPGSDGAACDDGNVCTDGDECQAGVCSGTALADGAPCSDGNACTTPDTCQGGTCASTPVANGTPCDDGNPCSRPDTCTAGTCGGIAPALTCKGAPPERALLLIDNRSPDTKDKLAWTWKKGAITTASDIGDPTTATAYTLCLYDNVGGVPQRRLMQTIPPSSRWKAFSRGYRYRDKTLSAGGLESITLTQGAAGKSSISVRGKGAPLSLPGLPLSKQPNVTIQLMSPNACWTSTFSLPVENSLARFKAKSD